MVQPAAWAMVAASRVPDHQATAIRLVRAAGVVSCPAVACSAFRQAWRATLDPMAAVVVTFSSVGLPPARRRSNEAFNHSISGGSERACPLTGGLDRLPGDLDRCRVSAIRS
ncbi:hypothetical protein ACFYUY_23890 [Kitasatospora sp. NPDC004745]|uniref:hypothetical protein n=1 Tax=Kitasatospora sp. NPDC004745 TaxID=3364019 RepID=UPI0036D1CA27